jgi:hypothetical protein
MGFEKGNSHSKGRAKGSKNKSTTEARNIFIELLNSNLPKIQSKLDILGRENPAKFIELILKLSEFAIPKLTAIQQVELLEPQTYRVSFDIPENN